MNTEQLIRERHSVRSYNDTPIPAGVMERLNSRLQTLNSRYHVNIVAINDEPGAFGSFMATYGKFKNVRNYMVLIAVKSDADAGRRLGYAGELAVLYAKSLGLDTCWVGLTYSKSKIPVTPAPDEKIYAVIAMGYGTDHGHAHKIKSPGQVAPGYDSAPGWFRHGVDMALLAPTALNQQKFKIELEQGDNVKFSRSRGPYTKIDLGIVSAHFDLATGRVTL